MPRQKLEKEELEGEAEVATPAATVDVAKLNESITALLGVVEKERAERNQQTQELLETIQSQGEQMQELREELNAVADKGRLADWDKKKLDGKTKQKLVNLQNYNGKVVVGWTPMKTNTVYKNQANAIVEDQTTELIFADNTRETVDYKKWQAARMPVECILESKEVLADETEIYNLADKAGNKYRVDVRFVN